jgi:hypothetical protein
MKLGAMNDDQERAGSCVSRGGTRFNQDSDPGALQRPRDVRADHFERPVKLPEHTA